SSSLLLRLVEDPEHDSLLAREAVAHVGEVIARDAVVQNGTRARIERRLRIDLTPLARRETVEPDAADARAHEPQRREADARGHAPHLPVLAFAQRELDPGGRYLRAVPDRRISRPEIRGLVDQTRVGGPRDEIAEVDAAA